MYSESKKVVNGNKCVECGTQLYFKHSKILVFCPNCHAVYKSGEKE